MRTAGPLVADPNPTPVRGTDEQERRVQHCREYGHGPTFYQPLSGRVVEICRHCGKSVGAAIQSH